MTVHKVFTITWVKVPAKIAVHVASRSEAEDKAVQYIRSLMTIEESATCWTEEAEVTIGQ
jgi:hypothetical protein